MRMKNAGLATVSAVAVLGLGSCDLVEQIEDLGKGITFDLPSRSYSVTSNSSSWREPPSGSAWSVPCGPGGVVADCCMPGGASGPSIDCQQNPLSCEEGACALKFTYEQVSKVDLASEVPALGSVKGQILSDVLLKQLDLQLANDFNVELPPIGLWVAPATVTMASHAQARKIATIQKVTPGFHGTQTVVLDSAAQAAFSQFAKDFHTPFNIIMSTTLIVRGDSPTPRGRLDVTIGGKVEARF